MNVFVAMLRAINVGGVKLLMSDLVELCASLGFKDAKTYIQSGNVAFQSRLSEAKAQAALAHALEQKLGRSVGVLLRTADELESALAHNPFREQPPSRVVVIFLPAALSKAALADLEKVESNDGERLAAAGREIFAYYPNGQGHSKLKVPHSKAGTGRNLNTVTKLAALARSLNG